MKHGAYVAVFCLAACGDSEAHVDCHGGFPGRARAWEAAHECRQPSIGQSLVDAQPVLVPTSLWVVATADVAKPVWQRLLFGDDAHAREGVLSMLQERARLGALFPADGGDWSTTPAGPDTLESIHETYVSACSRSEQQAILEDAVERVTSLARDASHSSVLFLVASSDEAEARLQADAATQPSTTYLYLRKEFDRLRRSGVQSFLLDISKIERASAASKLSETAAGPALRGVIEQVVSCDLKLRTAIEPGSECRGEVRIDGTPVGCNTADGFWLKDTSTLRLSGRSCRLLRQNPRARIEARFPARPQN